MSRRFFDQVDDELRGLVGPALRDFNSYRAGRMIKLWYVDPSVHFEAQVLGERWSPDHRRCLEIGLHLEAKDAGRNEEILSKLMAVRPRWDADLPAAETGPCFGPMGSEWRRMSELMDLEDLDDPDFASEVAERTAVYVRALYPLLRPFEMVPARAVLSKGRP
jgi:hypothetical protein